MDEARLIVVMLCLHTLELIRLVIKGDRELEGLFYPTLTILKNRVQTAVNEMEIVRPAYNEAMESN